MLRMSNLSCLLRQSPLSVFSVDVVCTVGYKVGPQPDLNVTALLLLLRILLWQSTTFSVCWVSLFELRSDDEYSSCFSRNSL